MLERLKDRYIWDPGGILGEHKDVEIGWFEFYWES